MNRELVIIIAAFVCFAVIACVTCPTVFRSSCVSDGMRYGYESKAIQELCK